MCLPAQRVNGGVGGIDQGLAFGGGQHAAADKAVHLVDEGVQLGDRLRCLPAGHVVLGILQLSDQGIALATVDRAAIDQRLHIGDQLVDLARGGGHQLERADVEGRALRARDAALVSGRATRRSVDGRAAAHQGIGESGATVVGQCGVQDAGQRCGQRAVAGGADVAAAGREVIERLRITLPAVAEQVEVVAVDRAEGGVDFLLAGCGIAGDQAALQIQRATVEDGTALEVGSIAADRAVAQRERATVDDGAAPAVGGVAADCSVA